MRQDSSPHYTRIVNVASAVNPDPGLSTNLRGRGFAVQPAAYAFARRLSSVVGVKTAPRRGKPLVFCPAAENCVNRGVWRCCLAFSLTNTAPLTNKCVFTIYKNHSALQRERDFNPDRTNNSTTPTATALYMRDLSLSGQHLSQWGHPKSLHLQTTPCFCPCHRELATGERQLALHSRRPATLATIPRPRPPFVSSACASPE